MPHHLHNSTLARKFQQSVQNEMINEPGVARLSLENGTYIGYTKTQEDVQTRNKQELCSIHTIQQLGGRLRHSQRGKSNGERG